MKSFELGKTLSFLGIYRQAKDVMNRRIWVLTKAEPGMLQEQITLVAELSQVREEFWNTTMCAANREGPNQRRCYIQIKLGVKRIDHIIRRHQAIVEEDYGVTQGKQ